MHQQPRPYSARTVGILCLLLGAVLFSSKGVIIKLAYEYGVSSISLLGLRMIFSLPLFLLIGYVRGGKKAGRASISTGDFIIIISLGVMGYYLASYTDFLGLRYLSAGMERVILFTYPTMVLIIQRLVFGTPIRPVQWVATGICYLGIVIAFSGSDLTAGGDFLQGAALIFLSALLYSTYIIGSGRLAPKLGNVRFTSIALITASVAVILHVLLSSEPLLGLPPMVYAYAGVMAVFCTVIPSYLVTEGVRRLGAGDAAIIGAVGPVATIVLEYFALHEHMNGLQGLGAVFIIAGVVIIGRSKG
ncbi:drug/metabolite transporter (DMT)-like permease [Lewinella aquimaris]|uniref:Drug/metabolite transporter (DMT)-like permease n=1 Tax=Neolewinella aquimaris TaxID=1835722 RepID=A0A840DY81_9BACT|nr:DMT family transporter [Neolewinella aquimaris]MBB4077880.1 drug/metabolite transporter (DMT)-like permease [Neolewinella aquimaris]